MNAHHQYLAFLCVALAGPNSNASRSDKIETRGGSAAGEGSSRSSSRRSTAAAPFTPVTSSRSRRTGSADRRAALARTGTNSSHGVKRFPASAELLRTAVRSSLRTASTAGAFTPSPDGKEEKADGRRGTKRRPASAPRRVGGRGSKASRRSAPTPERPIATSSAAADASWPVSDSSETEAEADAVAKAVSHVEADTTAAESSEKDVSTGGESEDEVGNASPSESEAEQEEEEEEEEEEDNGSGFRAEESPTMSPSADVDVAAGAEVIWCVGCHDDPTITSCTVCGCQVCHGKEDTAKVLLCDGCEAEYHLYCLQPALDVVPSGDWFCPPCATGEHVSEAHSICCNLHCDSHGGHLVVLCCN
jgi:hypothetical protein